MKRLFILWAATVGWGVTGGFAELIHEPSWPGTFQTPAGWKCQHDANGAMLSHEGINGLILVLPHSHTNLTQVLAQMRAGLTEPDAILALDGEVKPLGAAALAANYKGTMGGAAVVARSIGTVSANGGGAYVAAIAAPEQFGEELRKAAETLADSVTVPKVDPADVAKQFVGRWMSIGKTSQSTLTIDADGTYAFGSESTHSGQFRDSGGNDTGHWGVMGQNQQRGYWAARGTREQGVFQLITPAGVSSTVDYRVHVEKGLTYWNEYYIDGKLYARVGR